MLSYEQQESAFFSLIDLFNAHVFGDDMEAKIEQWDPRTGTTGFPNTYSLRIKYSQIPGSSIDLSFYLDKNGTWSKVEIVSMDIDERYRRMGYGRRLVNHTIQLSKRIGARKIYGMVLDKPGYSSAEFYEKCGFTINNGSVARVFYMDIE